MLGWIKREIEKFVRCERSAVTVLVTFLLIPAILVTGTGVEMARVFANRAKVVDAGELAANAALSQYDAILKDMYGLFAIAMTDDDLSDLLDAYVKAAFEESDSTLSLNAGEVSGTLNTADSNYYLSNKEILARQIEEYCKIRGIGALATDLIDKFNIFDFGKLKIDLDIFDKKLEADDQFKALLEQYGDLYYRMRYNDYFVESSTKGIVGKLNDKREEGKTLATKISTSVSNMLSYKEQYDSAPSSYAEDELAEVLASLSESFDNEKETLLSLVESFTNDFPNFTHSTPDSEHKISDVSEKPWYVKVVADITGYTGLANLFDSPGSKIAYFTDNYDTPDCLTSYSYNLEQISGAANAINKQIDEFEKKQQELETSIANGSDLTQSTMTDQTKVYDQYMNRIDVDGLISAITSNNKQYVTAYQSYFTDAMFEYAGSDVGYDKIYSKINTLTLSSSTELFDNAKGISYNEFASATGWEVFCKHTNDGLTGNPFAADAPDGFQDLYWILALQYVNTDAGTAKSKVESALNNIGSAITGLTESLAKGLQPYPLGHDAIPDELTLPSQGIGAADASGSFTLQFDKIGESNEQTRNSLKDLKKIIESFTTAALDNAADKALLTVYATHMFSNYATAKRESMAGYRFNPQLNYLQGAEQEYIIIGDRVGINDLTAFGAIIVSIRTVLNFASTFVVPEINALVNSVASAAAAVPFVGPALWLLVQGGMRIALATGESLVDLYLLRKGESVLFFKFKTGDFVVGSPVGFAKFTARMAKIAAGTAIGAGIDLTKDLIKDGVSTGGIEFKSESNPGFTSAKLLDDEARRKFDNSSTGSDIANLGIDATVDVYTQYRDRLDEFVDSKIDIQASLYLGESATERGFTGSDRDDFISGYKSYITAYHPTEASKNAEYEEIKKTLERDAEQIEDYIEWARLHPDTTNNDYFNEFKNIPGNSDLIGKVGQAISDKFKDTFEQFTPSGMIDNIRKKFSLENLLGVDYSFYSGAWIMLTINRDDLLLRMADLISLNVANKSSKLTPAVGDYENFAAFGYDVGYALTYYDGLSNGKLPPMPQETFDKYSLDKRRVFVQVDVSYDMRWTFLSLGLFTNDPLKTEVVFPKTYPIRESVYRGY